MIKSLIIRNIALIESVSLHFHHGLTVLSGETGAGKSIIIDAINIILGERADRNLIRSGCDKAYVEAEFEIETIPEFEDILAQESIESDGGLITLYREFSQNGRNVCRINGVMVTLALLKKISSYLLNLHGQSEHQFLADESRQLPYLDLMGAEALCMLKMKTREAYDRFIFNHRYYAKLVKLNDGKDRKYDLLKHELNTIHLCDIHPGDEKKLAEEAKHLNKSSRIHEKLQKAFMLIGNGENGLDSLHNLQQGAKELRNLGTEDPQFEHLADQCEDICYTLDEIMHTMKQLNQQYEFDETLLGNVENRLESVRRLLKKYGPSEEDVLRHLEELEKEFNELSELDDLIDKTRKEHKKLLSDYRSAAKELSALRRETACGFEKEMIKELSDLGMQQTVFRVEFDEFSDGKPVMPSPDGDDRIRFLISPNSGEPLKPLASIASGGELSRLMLALKTIESNRHETQTMIFDEIDTGISGRIAQAVAEKLFTISRHQQVICISHLPQIAAAADHQYLVYKETTGGRTVTGVNEMTSAERIEDIARMISGAQGISDNARDYAGQLISSFSEKKKMIYGRQADNA